MKQRLTVYGLIGLALLVAWGAMVFVPAERRAAKERSSEAAAKQRLLEVQQCIVQVPALLEAEKKMADRRLDLNSKLYARDDVLHLFDNLKSEAAQHKLQIEEITPPVEELLALNKTAGDADQPQFINMTVRLTGGYINFGRFVQALEGTDYFRGVNRCLVTGSADGKEPLQMTVGFKALLGTRGVTS